MAHTCPVLGWLGGEAVNLWNSAMDIQRKPFLQSLLQSFSIWRQITHLNCRRFVVFPILSLLECAKSKSNQQYKREKKAFNKAWAKKLLMTQKEDDNKSLGNFSSSTSCLNWQEWTHFSQLRRGKGRTSIQAGSNLPWNNTSSKISPSPLMLQRLQSLESTKIQFPLTPD